MQARNADGDVIINGKRIIFNSDGTVTWSNVQ